jgi:light-regulated signal transduction histidine kinase (bacteriophytochrome)
MVMDVLDLHRHGQLLTEALDQVRRTTHELQRSNASLQHFAGQVSHDLKNPLTGVLGFVAMLADTDAVIADPPRNAASTGRCPPRPGCGA